MCVRDFTLACLLLGFGGIVRAQPIVPRKAVEPSEAVIAEGLNVAPVFCDTLVVFSPLDSIGRSEWSGAERLDAIGDVDFGQVGPVGLILGGALGGFAAWSEHGSEGTCGVAAPSCALAGHPGDGASSDTGSGNRAAAALLLGGVSAAMGALVGVVAPDRNAHHVRIEPYLTVGPAGGWFAGARVCLPLSESRLFASTLPGRSR